MRIYGRAELRAYFLWTMLGLYVLGRFGQLCTPKIPILAVVILHVLPAAAFALVHCLTVYRFKGFLIFATLCLGVASVFETLSLRTGFPFGHYYFTEVMGPKWFQLPILLALAYLGIGYVSWVLALVILGYTFRSPEGTALVALPLLASFIMVAWDLSMDPVWATIDHAWIWKDGGPYFGVPISNFLGWFLTVYFFYQLFILYLRWKTIKPLAVANGYLRIAVLFYGACAGGNLLVAVPSWSHGMVTDPSGHHWEISSIVEACILVSIFVMGPFVVMGWMRIVSLPVAPTRVVPNP